METSNYYTMVDGDKMYVEILKSVHRGYFVREVGGPKRFYVHEFDLQCEVESWWCLWLMKRFEL